MHMKLILASVFVTTIASAQVTPFFAEYEQTTQVAGRPVVNKPMVVARYADGTSFVNQELPPSAKQPGTNHFIVVVKPAAGQRILAWPERGVKTTFAAPSSGAIKADPADCDSKGLTATGVRSSHQGLSVVEHLTRNSRYQLREMRAPRLGCMAAVSNLQAADANGKLRHQVKTLLRCQFGAPPPTLLESVASLREVSPVEWYRLHGGTDPVPGAVLSSQSVYAGTGLKGPTCKNCAKGATPANQ
jgi:hypothetical protein